jgi:pimeloyl-ACP methyl ester carboxylesterase
MTPAASGSRARRWLRRIALGIVGLIVLAVVVGSVYEFVGRRAAASAFPPPGKLVDIGGRRIQLDCRGTGSPIVVFEAGLDINGSLSWSAVHDSVARTTRACAYSRAGIMWSDPNAGPHNAATIAADLHAALQAAGERPPYVLVGHSLGGPYIMTYTKTFGADVAGLVFVDASHPDQVQRFKGILPDPASGEASLMKVAAALSWTGVVRLAMRGMAAPPNEPERGFQAMRAYAPTSLGSMLKESDAIDTTMAQAGSLRQLGDRPIVVLTANKPMAKEMMTSLKLTPDQAAKFQALWRSLHDEEASWSTRSRHQLVDDATHYIQFDRPDVVIAAVRSVVDSVRARPGA